MAYLIRGIDSTLFEHLFGLHDDELRRLGVRRYIVDSDIGYPDRVSVSDLSVGDSALLVNFEHLSTSSPYSSKHAIFVAERPAAAAVFIDSVPAALGNRLLSVRSFDVDDFIVDAEVVDGKNLEQWIESAFNNKEVQFIHVHTARRGCFLATVTRTE